VLRIRDPIGVGGVGTMAGEESHYKRRQLEFMAAWFPGDPTHEPSQQLCACGQPLVVMKDAKGVEWYGCETERDAIAANA
jgi:hypothetical protein